MEIYVISVKRLENEYKGYCSETHVYSLSIDDLKSKWRVLFGSHIIMNSGEWEMQPRDESTWFNHGVVTRDAWGTDYQWSLSIYPLHEINEVIEVQS